MRYFISLLILVGVVANADRNYQNIDSDSGQNKQDQIANAYDSLNADLGEYQANPNAVTAGEVRKTLAVLKLDGVKVPKMTDEDLKGAQVISDADGTRSIQIIFPVYKPPPPPAASDSMTKSDVSFFNLFSPSRK